MAAPKGNQFWKARSKHGRDKIFKDSSILWEACEEYFQWVADNPLEEAIVYQGKVSEEPKYKMRAMTISGLCLFLDIDVTTWADYRKQDDFSQVINRAEKVIYNQKFEGAAADMLNPNIIARDLGLADKKDNTHKGAIGVVDLTDKTDEELLAIINGS
jgi:hypothetical protein